MKTNYANLSGHSTQYFRYFMVGEDIDEVPEWAKEYVLKSFSSDRYYYLITVVCSYDDTSTVTALQRGDCVYQNLEGLGDGLELPDKACGFHLNAMEEQDLPYRLKIKLDIKGVK